MESILEFKPMFFSYRIPFSSCLPTVQKGSVTTTVSYFANNI